MDIVKNSKKMKHVKPSGTGFSGEVVLKAKLKTCMSRK